MDHRRWILDAWTREEALLALRRQSKVDASINKAYFLCGGSIHRMMYACDDEQRMRGIMTEAVRCDIQEVASEYAGPQRPGAACLFAMFRDKSRKDDSRMDAIQYIDSSFALDQLDQWDRWAKQIDVDEYAKGYLLGKTCGDLSMQGWFYERIMHRWFLRAISETRPSPINGIQEVWYHLAAREKT
jgi:hypothetical protein